MTAPLQRREIGHAVVLTNPAAGHGNAARATAAAVARLQHRGIDAVEVVGADADDARRRLDAALQRGTDALVAVGGDGMIFDALQALAGSDTPLGIVAAGTGNDHARAYGLPIGDAAAAADIIADGWVQTVDLGRITDGDGAVKWFGTVVAAGFDSLVSDRTNRMRWPRGRARYYLAMLAELSRLRPLPFRLVFDDRDEIIADLTLAAVGNTGSYGGGMRICPDADPTDGLLDVTMVHATSRTRLVRLFPTVFAGTHVGLDRVTTARAASVRVECPDVNAYADGEYACPMPIQVAAVPAGLRVLRAR